jgi:ABC-type Fe3+-hydroxamate transport system substrate-binding protein
MINRKEGSSMAAVDDQAAFVKTIQEKFEKKLKDHEIAQLDYWKVQLDKILALKPDGVASLQLHIRKVSDMMGNRIKVLKRE